MEIPLWASAVAELEALRPSFVHTIWEIGTGTRGNLRPTTELARRYLAADGTLTPDGSELFRAVEAARVAYEDSLPTLEAMRSIQGGEMPYLRPFYPPTR
jgi:hypothetical protein